MRYRILLASCIATTLLSASCAPDPTPYRDVAQSLLDSAPRVTPEPGEAAPAATSACATETIRDEYGFAIEIQLCDDAAVLQHGNEPAAPTELSSWLGSPDAAALSDLVRHAAITSDCRGPSHDEALIDQLFSRRTVIAASPDPAIAGLAPLLRTLANSLDALQSACVYGEENWVVASGRVANALAAITAYLGESVPA